MPSSDGKLPIRSRAKIENKWGDMAWAALQALAAQLKDRGFDGPLSLKEAGFLPFRQDPCDSIRVIASVSRCGSDSFGHGLFDVVLTVWSATIFRGTTESDPWHPVGAGYESWHRGYVACLVARLSHLKWAEAESTQNPAWAMTLDGVEACLRDLDLLVMPRLHELRADVELAKLLDCVLRHQPPRWVRSDRPGMRNLGLLAQALQRGVAPASGSGLESPPSV